MKKDLLNTGLYTGATLTYLFVSALKARGYTSILKGIYLTEENLKIAKTYVKLLHKDKKVKIKYRGKRKHHPDHTLKSEATHFDVYVVNEYKY